MLEKLLESLFFTKICISLDLTFCPGTHDGTQHQETRTLDYPASPRWLQGLQVRPTLEVVRGTGCARNSACAQQLN